LHVEDGCAEDLVCVTERPIRSLRSTRSARVDDRRYPLRRMRAACSIGIVAAVLFSAGTLSAQDATERAVDTSVIGGHVRGYYRGERVSAFMVLGLGLAGVGAGIPLLLQDGDFERGAGWTALILGGLEVIGAIAYAIDVSARMNYFEAALAEDPAAFREEETAHMDGTISRFLIYLTTEIVMTLTGVGIAAAGFASGEDVLQGVGISMAALWFPIVMIDLVNQQRGRIYVDRVRRMYLPTRAF
jgi:hypothetical protein